jgi:hypothetical protein
MPGRRHSILKCVRLAVGLRGRPPFVRRKRWREASELAAGNWSFSIEFKDCVEKLTRSAAVGNI